MRYTCKRIGAFVSGSAVGHGGEGFEGWILVGKFHSVTSIKSMAEGFILKPDR